MRGDERPHQSLLQLVSGDSNQALQNYLADTEYKKVGAASFRSHLPIHCPSPSTWVSQKLPISIWSEGYKIHHHRIGCLRYRYQHDVGERNDRLWSNLPKAIAITQSLYVAAKLIRCDMFEILFKALIKRRTLGKNFLRH